jgi:putative tryptophan/tyrosine transport system substrate-binding protein
VRRRDFFKVIGGGTVAWPWPWPFAARAQERPKLPTIGFLGTSTLSAQRETTDAFVRRLRELGWAEGRTVAIEYRWAEGDTERFAAITKEFIRLKVDVIVTQGTSIVLAARQVTSDIPIVFASAGDPLGNGLVTSLAHPGGNVTGLSSQSNDSVGKRFTLLRQIVPKLRRIALLGNVDSSFAVLEMGEVQSAARILGLEVTRLEIRRGEDIATVFAALKDQADALYIATDPLTFTHRNRIQTFALAARLPTTASFREFVEAGALMSYGSNLPSQYRRAAEYVDKILHGAKPGDIPVEQPTKFDLVINVTTARALGLEVPATLLATADEVIE